MKIAIFPPNSLILADLVERRGHEPLVLQREIRKRVTTPEIDSPPLNMTEEDPIKGLQSKYLQGLGVEWHYLVL